MAQRHLETSSVLRVRMGTKTLLLDIDGVLVRDRLLLEHVRDNCISYVRAKLPLCKDPRKTCDTLYLVHGHTARGLQVAYDVDVSDFNSKVYDTSLMNHLADVLSETQVKRELEQVYSLSNLNWNIMLFTNAPWKWAAKVAVNMGDNVSIKCPGNPASSPLKPDVDAYAVPFSDLTVFVDDSLKNLGTARNLTKWIPVYFNGSERDPTHKWCPQVNSINDICTLVKTLDT